MTFIVNAITVGSLYALLAVGLSLVYGVMRVPHFAQAGVIAAAALVMVWLSVNQDLPFIVAALAAVLLAGVIGVATERLAYWPVGRRGQLAGAGPAVALGVLLILGSSNLLLFGAQRRVIPTPYSGDGVEIAGERISATRIAVVVLAAVSIAALQLFLKRTRLGRSIVAVSQDRLAAELAGIRVGLTHVTAFFVSGLLAGAAALAYGSLTPAYPYMADTIILSAFVVIIIGGLGSVYGAVVGGLLVGAAESFGTLYIAGEYAPVYAFAVLLIVLSVKPTGLFGRQVRTA